jgi:RHS repeat-associated protein
MAGISSKAAGKLENKFKYNGIEHNTDFDLNMYDAFYRNLDPQIGRFWQIDPEAEMLEEYSPYASMYNNPINIIDPFGDFGSRFGAWLHKVFHGGGSVGKNEHGEWYVNKTRTESTDEGGVAAVGYKYYGEGRNQYSNKVEALLRQDRIQTDIWMNGENSRYTNYESEQEAGNAALTIGTGVLLPNPVLKNGTIAANSTKIKQATSSSQNLKTLSFSELQTLVKKSSDAMNAYFKSKGKTIPTKEQLEAYKELSERIIQGTRGAPASKASTKGLEVQTQRLEMINETLKLIQ